jgi:tetratricopeptide (TPR) repeat protein
VAAVCAIAVAAYSGSFRVPFLYDDTPTIVENPTLRHLASALFPPNDTTAGGRPVLNLSLAVNYAAGGTSVWGYHAVNLAIHIAAALALVGIVRRTLAPSLGSRAWTVAFVSGAIWVSHPLQTEAVTYVVQRGESLMALFYLATLYAFIRFVDAGSARRSLWACACVAACALGMGTKEVMVSAPLMVFLYDRTFVSGGFRAALSARMGLYPALALTWIPLAFLVASTHGRGGTAGTSTGVTSWGYGLTQFYAVTHYLRLCFWPHPLVFDYGTALASPGVGLLMRSVAVIALGGLSLWAIVRRPGAGFVGALFFAVLAPSSSLVPVATETMAEHRMYLPLAAVVTLVVVAAQRSLGRALLPIGIAVAACLTLATRARNEAYRSALSIWTDTVSAYPSNARAHANLGAAWLEAPGHLSDAIAEYEASLRLKDDPEVRNDLGSLYLRTPGSLLQAVGQYEAALRLRPGYAEAHNNLANALSRIPGRLDDAVLEYRRAIEQKPGDAELHANLGSALSRIPGRLPEAVAEYEEALKLQPSSVGAHNNLGNALLRMPGRASDAVREYEAALAINPGDAEVHNNLGYALSRMTGHGAEAESHYREAIRLDPGYAEARNNLGNLLVDLGGRVDDAIAQYREAIRIDPGYARAHGNLGNLLATQGRTTEAIDQFEQSLRLNPNDADTHFNFGNLWMGLKGHAADAIAQYEEAVRLDPANPKAHNNLGYALSDSQERHEEAVGQFREALRLSPDYAMAHLNLAIALADTPAGAAEAIQHFEAVVRLRPDNAEAHLRLAVLLLDLPARQGEAAAHLREVLRLQPENEDARRLLEGLGQRP